MSTARQAATTVQAHQINAPNALLAITSQEPLALATFARVAKVSEFSSSTDHRAKTHYAMSRALQDATTATAQPIASPAKLVTNTILYRNLAVVAKKAQAEQQTLPLKPQPPPALLLAAKAANGVKVLAANARLAKPDMPSMLNQVAAQSALLESLLLKATRLLALALNAMLFVTQSAPPAKALPPNAWVAQQATISPS